MLSSRSFDQAGRAKDFLKFVVEETLAGRGSRLKGYTVAIEVFGKPADFDAQSDPLVRVEAGRLRRRLADYYLRDGASDPVHIALPRGSYVPQFQYAPTADAVPGQTEPRARCRRPAVTAVFGLTALMLIAAAGVIALRELGNESSAADGAAPGTADAAGRLATTGPRVLVANFENIGAPELDYFAFGMTEELIIRLSRLDLRVIAGQASYAENAGVAPEPHVDVGYILTGTVRNAANRIRVTARLVAADTNRQIWTRAFDGELDAGVLLEIQEQIATSVATTMGEPFGPIFDAEIARALGLDAENLDAHDCFLRFLYAAQVLSEATVDDVTSCFERTLQTAPDYATGWAALANLYRMQYEFGYVEEDGISRLERAMEAARRALDIDGRNALAHQAMATVRRSSGDIEGFEQSVERALSLNPWAAIVGSLGTNLVLAGDSERGLQLIDQALQDSPRSGPFFFTGYVVYYLRMRNYEEALSWASRMDAPQFSASIAFVAALAARTGQQRRAERAARQLLEISPTFPKRGRELIRRWGLGEIAEAELIDGLELAGLRLD